MNFKFSFIENLKTEAKLYQRRQKLSELKSKVSVEVDDLAQDEKVKRYIELREKATFINNEIKSCDTQITEIYREECRNQDHPVVLFLGADKDYHEGRTYYEGYCLSCNKKVTYPKGNMEYYRMLELRDGVTNIFEIMENATREYRLFRDCYYKYPGVLKDTKHADRIIYKAMRKRHENR